MFSLMNAISTPVQAVLDLFATDLADLRFADVDANVLARLASETHAASEAVAVAQAALDTARSALQERQDALLAQAQRAHAYARVYAEGDDALVARLDAIALPRLARRNASGGSGASAKAGGDDPLVLSAEPSPAQRRRGRPRKADASESLEVEAMTLDAMPEPERVVAAE
jgi:hypothetical protein